MRLPRMSLLLVMLALLTSVTSASAECAWVVWIKYIEHGTRRVVWGPYLETSGVDPTRNECRQAALAMTRKQSSYDTQSATAIGVACFPDTVDPRGPKGK